MLITAFPWYLLVTVLGLVTFPLAYRLFPALKGRGYAFSRALGMLLWGYIFWLLGSFGLLSNNPGGIMLAFILVLGLVFWAWRKIPGEELREWFEENLRMVVTVEILFALAFIASIYLRGMYPDIIGTEKPMELAFINAILHSPTMPPHDPWLADYAISYYYFGYVMIAMLAQITGVSGGVAFNLGISTIFAMTAISAYGIVYNLLAALRPKLKISNALYSLFGPLFVLIISNVEGFLEYLHLRGWQWTQNPSGEWVSKFWEYLNLKSLVTSPETLSPDGQLRFWWWWRASRVINDTGLSGNEQEVIDEFPFFSYFLADLHPHVLVMPFVFLAIALTLNLYFSKRESHIRILGLDFEFSWETFALGVVIFGGLAFLNIWDFPWQVGFFAAAYVLRQAHKRGWNWKRLVEFLTLGVVFGVAGVAAYLPFYISFSSQAGGILPNLINPTSGTHLWIMFGTLLVPLFFFLGYLVLKRKDWGALLKGMISGFVFTLLLYGSSLLFASFTVNSLPKIGESLNNQEWITAGSSFVGSYGAESLDEILKEGSSRRFGNPGGWITLTILLGLALSVLWSRRSSSKEIIDPPPDDANPPSHTFAGLLILFGALLVVIPEFFFLRDQFSTRMNTIFKFYIQAWLFWGIAAAYASTVLLSKTSQPILKWIYRLVLLITLAIGLFYPIMAVKTRLDDFKRNPENTLQLDGTAFYFEYHADDKAAVEWLREAPQGTLVEAVGGSYTEFARISTYSGQPSLLGWPGHESQWRGGYLEMGTREQDINILYSASSWVEVHEIIKRYEIRYVYIGNLERATYNVEEGKFMRFLKPVFQQGSVTIYQVPDTGFQSPDN